MYLELAASQVERWMLNPYMYGLVALLLCLSMIRRVEPLNSSYWTATFQDYLYGVLYAVLYFPLIAICLEFATSALNRVAPELTVSSLEQLPSWAKLLVLILFDDFLSYWSHRLRHVVRPLWHFHAVHNSQENLNPFTTKKFHPFENFFHKVVFLLIPMTMLGLSFEGFYIYLVLDAAWDYFIHSNIKINLGPLERLIVTPQYHRIHHSRLPEHVDRNFSDRLVLWDQVFGTAHFERDSFPPTGVPGYLPSKQNSKRFLANHLYDLRYPFTMNLRDFREWLSKQTRTTDV